MSYVVELVGFRTDEILVIDACMNLCGLSMSDAANCVDNMPAPLIRNIELDAANNIKSEFDRMGIMVEIIPSESYDPANRKSVRGMQGQGRQVKTNPPVPPKSHGQGQGSVASMQQPPQSNSNVGSTDVDRRAISHQIQSQMPSMQASYNNDYSKVVEQSDYSENSQNYQNDYTLQYQQSGFGGFQTEEYTGPLSDDDPFGFSSKSNQQSFNSNEYGTSRIDTNEVRNGMSNKDNADNANGANKDDMNNPFKHTSSSSSKSSDDKDDKYSYSGSCPRCGSTFVSIRKSGGLFGMGKVKCVCDACGYKF